MIEVRPTKPRGICTLHVPTRRNGGCVERKGDKERASGCIGFRGERNSGLEQGFD